MKIADLFFKASLDDSRLAIDAKKSGEKAGAAAATGYKARMSGLFKSGFGLGVGIGAFNVLGSAISNVTSALGDATQAYREDAASQVQLRASLKANIPAWDGNSDAIERVLASRIKLGFSDDEQRASLATLITRTHDATKALQLQRVAMDLARLRGIDLGAATDLLGKAFSGQVGALRKAGIAVEANATATEALIAVQKAAGGQAEEYATSDLGRVEIAQVRAAESSERFGKALSRILTPLQELGGGVLEAVADSFDHFDQENQALTYAFEELRRQGVEPTSAKVQELARQFMHTSLEGRTLADRTLRGKLIPSVDDATGAADSLATVLDEDLADGAGEAKSEIQKLADEAEDAEEAIDDLADTIAEELFGDAINAGNEARLKEQIKDLRKQREEVKRGSPEWIRLTGEIAENQQQLFELQLQMKEKEGPRAVIAWLKQQRDKFGDTSGAIQKLINKYRTLLGLQSQIANSPIRTGYISKVGQIPLYAEGGHYEAGVPRIVGEDGPEFDVPDHSGTIYPDMSSLLTDYSGAPSSTNTWSSGMTIENLNVDARGATNPAATGTAVRQGVHDAMADVLRQQTARLPSGTRS